MEAISCLHEVDNDDDTEEVSIQKSDEKRSVGYLVLYNRKLFRFVRRNGLCNCFSFVSFGGT